MNDDTNEPKALQIIGRYGGIDGEHRKQWLLDQVVRKLAGVYYDRWVEDFNRGRDGADCWDTGIAP